MNYDVIIIGGSYAGLSAALVLGRSLRRVLVIDAGKPCNRQTPHSHGFLTRDGETPAQLAAIAREQVSQYPTVSFKAGTAVNAHQIAGGFRVRTDDGESYEGRKLMLATGLLDVMPDIPGFADCWGRSVLHCPYCHGYEVHSQPLGVLANGETGYEMATLIQQWSRQLTLFTNGPSTLTDEQQRVLAQLDIPIVETPLAAIEHTDGFLTALVLADGSRATPTALFARVPLLQTSDIAQQLGCELTDQTFVKVTGTGETTVPDVFAVGDATTMMRQVAVAAASGVKTAAWINRVLITDDVTQTSRLEANRPTSYGGSVVGLNRAIQTWTSRLHSLKTRPDETHLYHPLAFSYSQPTGADDLRNRYRCRHGQFDSRCVGAADEH